MKQIGFILLLFTQVVAAQPFKLSGKVHKPTRTFVIVQSHNPFSGLIKKDTIMLSGDGHFSTSISNKRPFFNLTLDIDSLSSIAFIGSNGGDVIVDMKPAAKPIIVGGSLKKVSDFMDADQKYFKEIYDVFHKRNPQLEQKTFQRTDAYFAIHDSITLGRIAFMKNYFHNPIASIEKRFLEYYEWNYLATNLYYKQSYNNAPFERIQFIAQKLGKSSGNYYQFSDLFDLDSIKFTILPGYQQLVYSMLLAELNERRVKRNEAFTYSGIVNNAFSLINELTSNNSARTDLKLLFLTRIADELDRNKNIDDLQLLPPLLLISEIPAENENFIEIKERIKGILSLKKFSKGSIAPNFKLQDINGKIVNLVDLKGKRLIIDISASWCSPCIAYIPVWNKRVQENKDPKTIFVYLSIDNTKQEWVQFRKKHPAKGLQLFAGNGGFKTQFALDYEISILPNQIIIDEDGKIESYSFKD